MTITSWTSLRPKFKLYKLKRWTGSSPKGMRRVKMGSCWKSANWSLEKVWEHALKWRWGWRWRCYQLTSGVTPWDSSTDQWALQKWTFKSPSDFQSLILSIIVSSNELTLDIEGPGKREKACTMSQNLPFYPRQHQTEAIMLKETFQT